MNNTYHKRGYQVPVNNYYNWVDFNAMGFYPIANDNGEQDVI